MSNTKGEGDNHPTPIRRGGLIWVVCFAMFGSVPVSGAIAAGLPLNFQPEISGWNGSNVGSCGYGQCIGEKGNGDPTPMSEYPVTIDSVVYYHVIVGDPSTGFAMESYVRAGPVALVGASQNDIANTGGGFSLDGGGNLRSVAGDPASVPTTAVDSLHNVWNSANPLGDYRISGNGGNAPDKSAFRMVMTSAKGDMSLDVSKPFLAKKPLISQTVQDGAMTSSFTADERGLTYSQAGSAAPVTNNLVLNDPSIPGAGSANFSMAKSQPRQSLVTAGRYTFTPGAGWNASGDPSLASDPSLGWDTSGSTFDFGTYNYIDPVGFQPLTFDWSTVFDYSQNAIACTAPHQSNGFTRENSGSFGGSCFNKP